jgi:hypothetical protein
VSEAGDWMRKEGGPKANQFTVFLRKWQNEEFQSWSRKERRLKDRGSSVEETNASIARGASSCHHECSSCHIVHKAGRRPYGSSRGASSRVHERRFER